MIGQPTAASSGFTGSGRSIAILDDGIYYQHPVFGSCTTPGFPAATCRVSYNKEIAAPDGSSSGASNSHGTSVAEVAARVAPSAKLVSVDVAEPDGAYTIAAGQAGFEWVALTAPSYNIASANYSAGSPGCPSFPGYRAAFENLVFNKKILPTVAAGNAGDKLVIDAPACQRYAVGVGASYNNHPEYLASPTLVDKVALLSNNSPDVEIFAPSYWLDLDVRPGVIVGGTSLSAPVVAAAATVLRASSRFSSDTASCILKRLQVTAELINTKSCGGYLYAAGCETDSQCAEGCQVSITGNCVGGPFPGDYCHTAVTCGGGGTCPTQPATFPRLNLAAAVATSPTRAADCNNTGSVNIGDLIKIQKIAFGGLPLSACPTADYNGNLVISITELISGVNASLTGCPVGNPKFVGNG